MELDGIVTRDWEHCFNPACRSYLFLERHHCLHGTANRKIAERFGLVVPLCRRCHKRLHDNDIDLDRFIQRAGEKAFIEKYHPNNTQDGISEFIKIFGKNYLYDTEALMNYPEGVSNRDFYRDDDEICDKCGKKLYKGDLAYEINDKIYCTDCIDEVIAEFEVII